MFGPKFIFRMLAEIFIYSKQLFLCNFPVLYGSPIEYRELFLQLKIRHILVSINSSQYIQPEDTIDSMPAPNENQAEFKLACFKYGMKSVTLLSKIPSD